MAFTDGRIRQINLYENPIVLIPISPALPATLLAHAGAAPHMHPHGIDTVMVLVAGGLLLILALGLRARRRAR